MRGFYSFCGARKSDQLGGEMVEHRQRIKDIKRTEDIKCLEAREQEDTIVDGT